MALDDIGVGQKGKVGEFPVLYQELIDIFDELVIQLKTSLRNRKSNASRALSQSIVFVPKRLGGNSFRFQLKMEDYWQWVNDGRKAGKRPPIEPILKWIAQKGIKPTNFRRGKKPDNLRQFRSLAYAIATNIGKKGTKGNNFYTDVIPSEKEFVRSVTKRLAKAAKHDVLVQIKYFDK